MQPSPAADTSVDGSYVGTCLVQVPDENGRWQPVKLTASMCGSPVGSQRGSLAPSETTIGGKSLRAKIGGGPMSIPEADFEDEDGYAAPPPQPRRTQFALR